LAFDVAGNLFAADNHTTIYRFTPAASRTTFASGLLAASALTFDATGRLFVSDTGTNFNDARLYRFTPGGVRQTIATGLTACNGMAFDRVGDLFWADYFTGNIYKFATNGARSTFTNGLNQPSGVAFNNGGELFVVETGADRILRYRTNGARVTFAVGLPYPTFLTFAPDPSLSIVPAPGRVTVNWTPPSTNYVLQLTTNLASGNWEVVTNAAPGTEFVTTLSPAFFRLQRRQ
jgi:sugar lactone lactonase YvrE